MFQADSLNGGCTCLTLLAFVNIFPIQGFSRHKNAAEMELPSMQVIDVLSTYASNDGTLHGPQKMSMSDCQRQQ